MPKSKSQAKNTDQTQVVEQPKELKDSKTTRGTKSAKNKNSEKAQSAEIIQTKPNAKNNVHKNDVADIVKKEKKPKRSFKAVYVNPQGEVVIEGRYCGAKPKQAGCKALTGIYKLFAKSKKQIKGEIYFGVYETTRGSRNKTYYYSGERVILDEPIELKIQGKNNDEAKTITYKYNSNVKKAQEADCEHLSNPKEVDADADVDENDNDTEVKLEKKQKKIKTKKIKIKE